MSHAEGTPESRHLLAELLGQPGWEHKPQAHRACPRGTVRAGAGVGLQRSGTLAILLGTAAPASGPPEGTPPRAPFLHGNQWQGPNCLFSVHLFSLLDVSGSPSFRGPSIRFCCLRAPQGFSQERGQGQGVENPVPRAFLLHWALSDEKYPVLSPRRLSSSLCGLGRLLALHARTAREQGRWARGRWSSEESGRLPQTEDGAAGH